MSSPLTFSEQGAHFRITDYEYGLLDGLARAEDGMPLNELPIVKATQLLRLIPFSSILDAVAVDTETGQTIASSEEDGVEALANILANDIDPKILHSVRNVGRVTVDVIQRAEAADPDAPALFSWEVLSPAHVWSKKVVAEHRAALHGDHSVTPVIPGLLLAQQPEGADVTLAVQGLSLNPIGGDAARTEILRIPRAES